MLFFLVHSGELRSLGFQNSKVQLDPKNTKKVIQGLLKDASNTACFTGDPRNQLARLQPAQTYPLRDPIIPHHCIMVSELY